MENACVVTGYDFVHKNHNFMRSDHQSLIKYVNYLHTHPRGACTLLVNHRSTGSKTPRTLTWTARLWRWRHYSPSELWNYSPSPIDTISSPRWWASHCKGYQVYRSPEIVYLHTISLTNHGGYIPESSHGRTNHGWCTMEHKRSTHLCSHSPKPTLHVLLLNTDQKHSNIKTVQIPGHTGQCYVYKETQY